MLKKYALIQLMQTIFKDPQKKSTTQELAKKAGISVNQARLCLEYLKEKGMVHLKQVGKSFLYFVDLEHPLVRQWKITFNLEDIYNSNLVKEAQKENPLLINLLIYGSFAEGTNDKQSDLDILAIATRKRVMLLNNVKLPCEVNILQRTPEEWRKIAETDKVFYDRVVMNSIPLIGEKPVIK